MTARVIWLCFLVSTVTCGFLPAGHDVLDNFRSFAQDYKEYHASGVMSDRFQRTIQLIRLQTPWKGANPKFDPLFLDLVPPQEKEPVMQ